MSELERKETFMELYRPADSAFQRFCIARTKSTDDAKDLINETLLKAYENLHTLRDNKAFLAFLFSIASNTLRKKFRRDKFWQIFYWTKAERILDSTAKTEEEIDKIILYETLKRLNPIYQEAITLHYISGYSIEEVATIQGSSMSAVKVRIMRGKQQLSKLLNQKNKNKQRNAWPIVSTIKA